MPPSGKSWKPVTHEVQNSHTGILLLTMFNLDWIQLWSSGSWLLATGLCEHVPHLLHSLLVKWCTGLVVIILRRGGHFLSASKEFKPEVIPECEHFMWLLFEKTFLKDLRARQFLTWVACISISTNFFIAVEVVSDDLRKHRWTILMISGLFFLFSLPATL